MDRKRKEPEAPADDGYEDEGGAGGGSSCSSKSPRPREVLEVNGKAQQSFNVSGITNVSARNKGRELCYHDENMVKRFHGELSQHLDKMAEMIQHWRQLEAPSDLSLPQEPPGENGVAPVATAAAAAEQTDEGDLNEGMWSMVIEALERFASVRKEVDMETLPWMQIQHQIDRKLDACIGITNFSTAEYKNCNILTADDSMWIVSTLCNVLGAMLPSTLLPPISSQDDAALQVHKWRYLTSEDIGVGSCRATSIEALPSNMQAQEHPVRYMDQTFPMEPVRFGRKNRPPESDRTVYWGQRKLTLMEIDFFSKHSQPGDVVVYIGSAPGHHLAYLAGTLFQDLHFLLFDPAPFNPILLGLDNVAINNEYFDMNYATQFSQRNANLLFVSDIRRLQHDEEGLLEDMARQAAWLKQIHPKASLLKFRLPMDPGQSLYLDGELWMQPYAAPYSYETRLVCVRESAGDGSDGSDGGFVPPREVVWDHEVYAKRLDHFNATTRMQRSPHEYRNAGLDDVWDSHTEIDVLRRFLRSAWDHRRYPFNRVCDMNGVSGVECPDPDAVWRTVLLSREVSYVLGWREDWREREVRSVSASGDNLHAPLLQHQEHLSVVPIGNVDDDEGVYGFGGYFAQGHEDGQNHGGGCGGGGGGYEEEYEDSNNNSGDSSLMMTFNNPLLMSTQDGSNTFVVQHSRQNMHCSVVSYRQMQGSLHSLLEVEGRTPLEECERHLHESANSKKRFVCAIKLLVNARDHRSLAVLRGICDAMADRSKILFCSAGKEVKIYLGESPPRLTNECLFGARALSLSNSILPPPHTCSARRPARRHPLSPGLHRRRRP